VTFDVLEWILEVILAITGHILSKMALSFLDAKECRKFEINLMYTYTHRHWFPIPMSNLKRFSLKTDEGPPGHLGKVYKKSWFQPIHRYTYWKMRTVTKALIAKIVRCPYSTVWYPMTLYDLEDIQGVSAVFYTMGLPLPTRCLTFTTM